MRWKRSLLGIALSSRLKNKKHRQLSVTVEDVIIANYFVCDDNEGDDDDGSGGNDNKW